MYIKNHAILYKAGTIVDEVHPPLTIQYCQESGCTNQSKAITVDSNWRWLEHNGENCFTGNLWNETECPLTDDGASSCAKACSLEGATYEESYGITTDGATLQLDFVTVDNNLTNVGSRTYLMNTDSKVCKSIETTFLSFSPFLSLMNCIFFHDIYHSMRCLT